MHGLIALNVAIGFGTLVLIASMHLLAKAKKESFGRLYNFLAYLIVIAAGLTLLCTVICGGCRYCCFNKKKDCKEMEMEKCFKGGPGGHRMMMWKGECEDIPCCKDMKGCHEMKCCKEMGEEEGGCPFDKKGNGEGDEKKCKGEEKKCCMGKEGGMHGMTRDTIPASKADAKAKK